MLVVAVIALRNPKHAVTSAGTDTRTVTPPAPSSVLTSAPGSRPPSTARSSASAPVSSPAASGSPSRSSTVGSEPLIVLNDTTTPNLARDAAQRFEGGGWNVSSFDENYSNDIASTVAYYDPSVSGAKSAALALQRQYPEIKRVAPRFAPAPGGDPLPAGPIVVVLTSDYVPG